MGTRALIVLQEPDGTELAVIYSQWDGCPSDLGKALGGILGQYEVGNGIQLGKVFVKPFANGMAELALHLICELKRQEWSQAVVTAKLIKSPSYPLPQKQYPAQIGHKPGGYYLYPAKTRDAGEEWLYFVGEREGKVWVRVAQAKDGLLDGQELWAGWAKDLATAKVYKKIEKSGRGEE